jgi:glycosyltransferase involved in cell wall biosynthesis
MPCFNERATLQDIVERVLASPYTAEVVIVDDGSTDGSRDIAAKLADTDRRVRLVEQPRNQGKGAALRRGFAEATYPFVIIQDADLEYDPQDYEAVLEPLLDDKADVVFGSRFLGGDARRVLYFWHSMGNKLLTLTSNVFTDLNLTDMETCYKAIRGDLARSLVSVLTARRFGFEPEITARLARSGARIFEVPISYSGRTYAEGKKIGWRDGIAAIWHITRFNLLA